MPLGAVKKKKMVLFNRETQLERIRSLFQLENLGNCIHIFDRERTLFVKYSFTNLKAALPLHHPRETRKELLVQIQWELCSLPNCRVKQCKNQHHWIGKV